MQTFSTMRRNSTDKRYLKIFFICVGLILYLALSDMYYFLPPLFGVAYVLAQESYENDAFGFFYFLVPFLIYFESSKQLPLFSTLLFMAFSFKIILPKFRKFFGYYKFFIPLFIAYAYFGFYAFIYIFSILFDFRIPQFSWIFAFYIACEVVLVWFFMWIL